MSPPQNGGYLKMSKYYTELQFDIEYNSTVKKWAKK